MGLAHFLARGTTAAQNEKMPHSAGGGIFADPGFDMPSCAHQQMSSIARRRSSAMAVPIKSVQKLKQKTRVTRPEAPGPGEAANTEHVHEHRFTAQFLIVYGTAVACPIIGRPGGSAIQNQKSVADTLRRAVMTSSISPHTERTDKVA